MIKNWKISFLMILAFVMQGCGNSEEQKKVQPMSDLLKPEEQARVSFYHSERSVEKNRSEKVMEVINYSLGSISALDFISRKGKQVAEEDKASLRKEQVLLLEIESGNELKAIFDSKRSEMNRTEVLQYLSGKVEEDIWVEQSGKEYKPTGHQYENSFGKQNRMRVYFFFKDLNLDEDYRVVFNDRMYGAGLINFRIKANHDV